MSSTTLTVLVGLAGIILGWIMARNLIARRLQDAMIATIEARFGITPPRILAPRLISTIMMWGVVHIPPAELSALLTKGIVKGKKED